MNIFQRLQTLLATAYIGVAVFGGAAFLSVQAPALVGAAPVDVLKNCDASSETDVCDDKANSDNSLYGLIKNIINLLLTAIGIIAVIMIVIGGIRYTTSAGDPGQTKNARDTIIYAVVGLVIAIMAYSIVNWVLTNI